MNEYVDEFDSKRKNWYAKLTNRKGTRRLYIRLVYFDEIICRTTGLIDTEENRQRLKPFIDKVNWKIARGEFVFEEAFPGASEEERRYFSEREGRDFRPSMHEITFTRIFEEWKDKAYPTLSSDAQRDNLSALESRVLPWFGDDPLDKITHTKIKNFIRVLAKPSEKTNQVFISASNEKTKLKLGPLSEKRLRTILCSMRMVWKFACQEYSWKLDSPFDGINKYITDLTKVSVENLQNQNLSDEEMERMLDSMEERRERRQIQRGRVLLMSEIHRILPHMHPLYRPAAELMLLTGMIPSEVAALRNKPIGEHLLVRYSLSRKKLKDEAKNEYRVRKIPVTAALRRVLKEATRNAADRPLLFNQIRGGFFNERVFRRAWEKACNEAGVERAVPYSLRHTFEANCEVLGLPKYRIIGLMGHTDKSMVDRVYGKYREGIEHEYDLILSYYGKDFQEGRTMTAIPPEEEMAAPCASSEQVVGY